MSVRSLRRALAAGALLLGLLAGGAAQAVEVSRQDTSVWVRTPWKNLEAAEQQALFVLATRIVYEKLAALRASGKLPAGLSAIDIEALIAAEKQIDEVARRLSGLSLLKEAVPDWIPWLPAGPALFQPSAFFILLGTKISFGFKLLSVGGSGNLGFIVTPFRVARMSEVGDGREIEAYHEIALAPLIWFHLDLGASLGGNVNSMVTVGVVGGEVRSVESFRGTAVGIEGTAALGSLGVTLHAGILSNWYEPGALQYPYLALSLENGLVVQQDVRLDLSQVLSDFPFYKIIAEDAALQALLTETVIVPTDPAP